MCKYCEEGNAIWFRKKNFFSQSTEYFENEGKRLGCIFDDSNEDSFFKNKAYLSVATNIEQEDWYDIRINYCPFCGKKLKYKSISNIIKTIIDYKYKKKYEKELDTGICKCSKCGKNIKNKLETGETITHEGKEIFCQECSKEKYGEKN